MDSKHRLDETGNFDSLSQAAVVAGLVEALAHRPWDQLAAIHPTFDPATGLTRRGSTDAESANQVLLAQVSNFQRDSRPPTTTPPVYRSSPARAAIPVAGGRIRGGGDPNPTAADLGRAIDTAARIYGLARAIESGDPASIVGSVTGLTVPGGLNVPMGPYSGGFQVPVSTNWRNYVPSTNWRSYVPNFPGRSYLPF